MKIYKVVKKEENPTISLSEVNFDKGFIIVTSDNKAVGIIVYDLGNTDYIFITEFKDYFSDFEPSLSFSNLEALTDYIKSSYIDPVEFNFIEVTNENRT